MTKGLITLYLVELCRKRLNNFYCFIAQIRIAVDLNGQKDLFAIGNDENSLGYSVYR